MASSSEQRGAFKDHEAAIRSLTEGLALGSAAKVVVLHGTCEVLLSEGLEVLRASVRDTGGLWSSSEAAALSENGLIALASQQSLFEPSMFCVLRRCEAAKHLAKLLTRIKDPSRLTNQLCFVFTGDLPSPALKKEWLRLKAHWVPCFTPWPQDLPLVLGAIAARCQLSLTPDAVQLLLEAHGNDLIKQANELRKLMFILPDEIKQRPLTAAGLAPHLGMLREDEATQLELLLAAGQWPKAHALVVHLLARGEKALALLQLLARHCRSMLRLAEAHSRGLTPGAVASATRVSPALIKVAVPRLRQAFNPKSYVRALQLCQQADLQLKSQSVAEDLLLTRVIDACAQS